MMFLASNSFHNLRGQKQLCPCYHARNLQEIHWNKLLCGMYGFTAKLSVPRLNICQILMKCICLGKSCLQCVSLVCPFYNRLKYPFDYSFPKLKTPQPKFFWCLLYFNFIPGHFDEKIMPSAGPLPYVQSLVCSFNNTCHKDEQRDFTQLTGYNGST